MTRILILGAILLAVLRVGPAQAGEADLHVVYLERPPYYWTDNGTPRGFLLELTQRIFALAGVSADYTPHPPNRILDEVRNDSLHICSIGWFRTPERETFASFSLPIYRDRPMVLLTTVENAERVSRHRTLREVFSDSSLIMAQMASFSYGEAIDRLQRETLVRNLTVTTSQKVLPRLILQGRASYMLVAPEEISVLLRSAEVDPARFASVSVEDIPAGNLRYLMFSRSVSGSIRDRINSAIGVLTDQNALLNPQP